MSTFMLVRHKVRDFTDWKAGYDAHRPRRQEAGLTELHLFHGSDDPREVVLLFEDQDLSRAKEFAASTDLQQKMQEVGVVDRPEIFFLKD